MKNGVQRFYRNGGVAISNGNSKERVSVNRKASEA
jgi:hypothetical protein